MKLQVKAIVDQSLIILGQCAPEVCPCPLISNMQQCIFYENKMPALSQKRKIAVNTVGFCGLTFKVSAIEINKFRWNLPLLTLGTH